MDIYIATMNEHKVFEFSNMFAEEGVKCALFSAKNVSGYEAPEETGTSFAQNAFIKAEALAKVVPNGAFVIADDSGLVVDALNGAPGVMSARYAGVGGAGADAANNKKLLEALEGVPDAKRTARFVCAIAAICPDGTRILCEGRMEGLICGAEKGLNGFGYDPLFLLPDRGVTSAELPPREKDAISHRGKAFRKLVKFLRQNHISSEA